MKKIILLSLLLSAAFRAGAQSEPLRRGPSFGGFVGLESQLLGAGGVADYRPDDPYIVFQNETAGLTLGGLARWPLLPGLSLQPELAFSFARNRAMLWTDGQPTGEVRYTFAEIEMPVHLVLSNPVGRLPLRGAILFGGRLGLNLASGDVQPSEGVGLLRERLGIDVGLGVEIAMRGWRIQPEVLYSHGMNNVHNDVGSRYDLSVDRILRDKIALRVVFSRKKL